MSNLKKYIQQLLKEKKHAEKNYKMYRDLYHGTIPSDRIHVKQKDWNNVINELREYRKILGIKK